MQRMRAHISHFLHSYWDPLQQFSSWERSALLAAEIKLIGET